MTGSNGDLEDIFPGESHDLGLPLDPRQIERISAVHGGFLYQHLYGVACLLTIGRTEGSRVIVERDEDLEVLCENNRHYVQVKTRSRPLQPGDVADAIERFAVIRREHAENLRLGDARFWIITNAELGPTLAEVQASAEWRSDTCICSPGRPHGTVPPAWPNIEVGFEWCVEKASKVPFGTLPPQTLVWKLASQVLHAATGAHDRSSRAEDMPVLLEQLLVQLQDFPDPPPHSAALNGRGIGTARGGKWAPQAVANVLQRIG